MNIKVAPNLCGGVTPKADTFKLWFSSRSCARWPSAYSKDISSLEIFLKLSSESLAHSLEYPQGRKENLNPLRKNCIFWAFHWYSEPNLSGQWNERADGPNEET